MAGQAHQDLIALASNWLFQAKRCPLVCTDLVAACGETPDAIGWYMGSSILVECKSSRADFLADRKKPSRDVGHSGMGIGCQRYYAAPAGLIRTEELPEAWGLLEPNSRGNLKVVLEATPRKHSQGDEIAFLLSVIRRMPADVKGVNCRVYTLQREKGEPLATVGVEFDQLNPSQPVLKGR
jgi:hypothetical protein